MKRSLLLGSLFLTVFATLPVFLYAQVPANTCGALGPANEYPVAFTCTPVAMNTNGMSPSINPGGCGAGNNDDAWAYFVATTTQTQVTYTNTGCSGFLCGLFVSSVLHVFDGSCGSLVQLGCDLGGFGIGSQGTVNVMTTPGNTYFVRVQRWLSDANLAGDLCITAIADPPVNDDCVDATVISEGVHPFVTAGATGVLTASCSVGDTKDVWFVYTPSCTGEMTVTTCGDADFDTALSLLDACSGVELACQDDAPGCAGFTSQLVYPAYAGQTYWIRVSGYQGESGSGNLTVSCDPVVWYSQGSGSAWQPIWARTPAGVPGYATFAPNASVVVQAGHTVQMDISTMHLKDFTVEPGGVFDAIVGIDLYVEGDWTIGGTYLPRTSYVQFRGGQAHSIAGAATCSFYDLELAGPGDLIVQADSVHVFGSLYLTDGDFNANGKEVVLRSGPAATARLGPVEPSASYTGNLRIQRYIPAGITNWRLLSSPVGGATVNQWKQDFFTAGFPGSHYPPFYSPPGSGILWPSIRCYNEPDPGADQQDGFIGPSGVGEVILAGRGYAAWCGDNLNTTTSFVIDVKGPPNIAASPLALPVSYTDTGSPLVDGWNLVGNPLPSALDFSDVLLGPDVEPVFWVFDPVSGNSIFWNESSGIGSGQMNGNIRSSQGFWLHATGPNTSTTVDESAKINDPNGGAPFGGLSMMQPILRLKIASGLNQFSDEALFHFGAGDPTYDPADVQKFFFSHAEAPQLWSRSIDSVDLALNAWGSVDQSFQLPLFVKAGVSGSYTVEVTEAVTAMSQACFELEDLLTGARVELEEGVSHSFQLASSTAAEPPRFMLHVAPRPEFLVSVSPMFPIVGEPILFSSGVMPGTPVVWDLGDGTISMDPQIQHSYAMPGNYTVVLTVGEEPCELQYQEVIEVSSATSREESRKEELRACYQEGALML
ncbi:MAG: PKD domain-containing protein, partial [Flavobacteriales bacterium]|nr:PKD domain-containing protein [Flavobacteriales bacterium]